MISPILLAALGVAQLFDDNDKTGLVLIIYAMILHLTELGLELKELYPGIF
jgi:hypothetical protein